jgi:predicted DNA-binding transcriptional regulator
VSERFKNNCEEQRQRDWNSYLEAMNTRMNLFVRAERTINEEMEKYEREFKNNK